MHKILVLAGGMTLLLFTACHAPNDTPNRQPVVLPMGAMVPAGTTIDGGAFSTLSGKMADQLTSSITKLTAEAALSYNPWPGTITMTMDGNTVSDYAMRFSSAAPLGSHTWVVTANLAHGIPAITHTIAAVPSFDITSPSMGATVTRPLTISWNTTTVPNTRVVLMVSRLPQLADTVIYSDTSQVRFISPDDIGSYTFTSSDLAGIPSGGRAKITVLRYMEDISAVSGKNYLFVNGYQDNVVCTIN